MIQTRKNEHRLLSVLLGPVILKGYDGSRKNEQVVFEVARDANKLEVKGAVELLFKVEVKSVQIVVQKGKAKRFGRFEGRRNHVKKLMFL
jgi:large subunit ribosomal protein L23